METGRSKSGLASVMVENRVSVARKVGATQYEVLEQPISRLALRVAKAGAEARSQRRDNLRYAGRVRRER
ncbi:MAG: hypothetical protein WAM14_07855 [Candidatus Nitrosopolaris sp.]